MDPAPHAGLVATRSNRRRQVLPEPQPISSGSMCHGRPLRKTNRMPVSTARSGWGFRPARWPLTTSPFRQQRCDASPQSIVDEALGHGRPYQLARPSTSELESFETHSKLISLEVSCDE